MHVLKYCSFRPYPSELFFNYSKYLFSVDALTCFLLWFYFPCLFSSRIAIKLLQSSLKITMMHPLCGFPSPDNMKCIASLLKFSWLCTMIRTPSNGNFDMSSSIRSIPVLLMFHEFSFRVVIQLPNSVPFLYYLTYFAVLSSHLNSVFFRKPYSSETRKSFALLFL